MVDVERIHEWRGEDVLDSDGEKVGRLYEVFYARGTEEPVFGSVRTGFMGRRCVLVPLAGATAGRGYLRVAHPVARVREVKTSRGAEVLSEDEVRAADEAYELRLPDEGPLESYSLLERRRAEAAEARRRADELEEESLRRAEDVKQAHARADAAAREADAAEHGVEEARRAALDARRAAESAEAAQRGENSPGAGGAPPQEEPGG